MSEISEPDEKNTPSAAPTGRPGRSLMQRIIPAVHPNVAAIVMLISSLIVTTRIWYPFDVQVCFLPWGEASGGWRFWDIYRLKSDCNYPPFTLYLLTLIDALRRLFHLGVLDTRSVILAKLPFILAHVAGALVCYYGLRRPFGGKAARRTALLYALCIALYVNAAQWGQADTLLALPMVLAAVLLVNNRPVAAGAAFGWGLSIKFQAVMIAPLVIAYCLRRFGIRPTLLGILAGVGTLAVITLPFVLAGTGKQALAAYTGAASLYPYRCLNSMNLWGATNEIERFRHPWLTEGDQLNSDTRAAIGSLSARHVGLLLLGAWNALLIWGVWRRPERDRFLLACGVAAFAFFILPTQMHERYGVPAAALLALPAITTSPRLVLFLLVSTTVAWNQWLVLLSNYLPSVHRSTALWDMLWGKTIFPISLLNCALLLFGTFLVFSGSGRKNPLPPAPSPTLRERGRRLAC